MESDAISRLLTQYPTLTIADDGKHVKCTLTGHEMPMKPDIVQAYAGSRRYSRLLSWYTSPYCEKYKHFLVDCNNKKRNRSQVYCALTKHFVNRTHWHLERHVNGAKFQDAYRRWLHEPWPLDSDSASLTSGAKTAAELPVNRLAAAPAGSESWDTEAAGAGKFEAAATDSDDDGGDDDDDADIDDIIGQTHHHKAVADDVKRVNDDDDDDEDSCSDLYPENDFEEMDVGETSQEGPTKNSLKRHVKPKKPAMLKDLKAKMRRTDDDDDDDDDDSDVD